MVFLIVIISLSILVFVHELGHFLVARAFGMRVDEFGIGFPPRVFVKKIGDTEYSINAIPFGGFVKIFGEDEDKTKNDNDDYDNDTMAQFQESEPPERISTSQALKMKISFSEHPVWKRSLVVLAGVLMNIVLGWLVLSAVFMTGLPKHLAITDVAPDSPASAAGIAAGDIVLRAERADRNTERTLLVDPITSDDFVSLVKSAPSAVYTLTIRRGSEVFDVSLAGREHPPEGQGSLGVGLVDIGVPRHGFFAAFPEAAKASMYTLRAIVDGFANLFAGLFTAPAEAVKSVSGPVGIFVISAQIASLGIPYLLQLMALISLNLAVLNLIPFPALDGGRLLFLVIEKLKGSPVSLRAQSFVNAAGFALLILLMIFVTVSDVGKLIN